MLWEYIKEVAKAAYDFALEGADIVEFLICGIVFFLPKWLAKNEKKSIEHETSVRKILWHKFLTEAEWRFFITGVVLIVIHCLIFAPFNVYKSTHEQLDSAHSQYTYVLNSSAKLQKRMEDKAPKLSGFINRILVANEPGTSNSLVFIEATIGNSGGSASLASDYGLRILFSKDSFTNAEEIYFADEYKIDFWSERKHYLIDLKHPQLLSEKTHDAIQPGSSPRGWMAFRVTGMPMGGYQLTNVILSFLDINDHRTFVTNEAPAEHQNALPDSEALTAIFPGSDNIISSIAPEVRTNTDWMPPELPSDCSNVVVFFGTNGIGYERSFVENALENGATKHAIKDLPNEFLKDADKMPNYSPRDKYLWVRMENTYTAGGKTFESPIQPIIISNRLYVEVQTPFSNEKHRVVMSDDFDRDLTIPLRWDRNYSTNYDANGGIFAYEVVNELTNPVLQVFYMAPNVVAVNGIFKIGDNSVWESFGPQPLLFTFTNHVSVENDFTQRISTASLQCTNFSEVLFISSNDSLSTIGEMFTNEFYRPIFPGQKTVFKYPSNRHLGEFAPGILDKSAGL